MMKTYLSRYESGNRSLEHIAHGGFLAAALCKGLRRIIGCCAVLLPECLPAFPRWFELTNQRLDLFLWLQLKTGTKETVRCTVAALCCCQKVCLWQ